MGKRIRTPKKAEKGGDCWGVKSYITVKQNCFQNEKML